MEAMRESAQRAAESWGGALPCAEHPCGTASEDGQRGGSEGKKAPEDRWAGNKWERLWSCVPGGFQQLCKAGAHRGPVLQHSLGSVCRLWRLCAHHGALPCCAPRVLLHSTPGAGQLWSPALKGPCEQQGGWGWGSTAWPPHASYALIEPCMPTSSHALPRPQMHTHVGRGRAELGVGFLEVEQSPGWCWELLGSSES